ncbi:5'-methylthioadenosine phosphorylase [Neisseria arctica]|uniref:Purine nucleoside phosphorylase n=1 Tax=Neisseria arctica TaxID=1470200 RepID=A0A0J1C360_9NEIS|nr:S-methyl-5'-thioinosine phosphorylase [Neisseria arctica]KLT72743.1 5'-methylthioadenosine phosphorylase [Neisseria arctica]UOO87237.1 S-methyl-5'-thioinosine phosphorylase [Neisseria arctica]
MIAIIGGSGLTRLPEMHITHREIVRTPYGLPSSPLMQGTLGSHQIVFLARHGLNHTLAPHEINYRANIWALHSLGVQSIVSVGSVTSLNSNIEPGSLVVPDDIIDYTSGRVSTFFEGADQEVVHTDFTHPYDRKFRVGLIKHAETHGTPVISSAVYGCIEGPRLPTRAEARRFRNDGADIIGMTGMPEAVLARELNIAYAHLCGVIGMTGFNDGHTSSPDFRSRQTHQAIEKIRLLLTDL